MKKKKYLIRTAKLGSLIIALLLFVEIAQGYGLAHYDSNGVRIDSFYLEDKNTVDVVFLGASEVYSGFSSGLAYEEYGFTSYPYVTGSNPISMYKSQLKEVETQQHPKLIVVEINGALYPDDKPLTKEANIRKYVDNIPLSANKIETISDNIPSEQQIEYFCPIIKYHSVWNDYPQPLKWVNTKIQYQFRGYNLLKGNTTLTQVIRSKKGLLNDKLKNDNSTLALTNQSEHYLRDFLQYCKDEKLDNIIFTRMPHRVDKTRYDRFKRGNEAGKIIAEYGYDYYNYEKDCSDMGIDVTKDYYNADHLNVWGQEKFTKYFGNVLCEKYDIQKTELTDSQKTEWDECVEYTHRFIDLAKEMTNNDSKGKWLWEDCETIEKLDNPHQQGIPIKKLINNKNAAE